MRLGGTPATWIVSSSEYDTFWAEVRRLPHRQGQAIALFYVAVLLVLVPCFCDT